MAIRTSVELALESNAQPPYAPASFMRWKSLLSSGLCNSIVVSVLGASLCACRAGSSSLSTHSTTPEAVTTTAPRSAADLYQQSRTHYLAGKYRVAASELEQAIQLDPELANLHFNLGLLYERMGMLDRAIASYERYARLVDSEEERDRTQKMVQRLEGARPELASLRQRPGLADGWFWTGTTLSVGTLTAGAITLVAGVRSDDRLRELMMMGAPPMDITQARSQADVLHMTSTVLLVSGVAFGITAVVLYAARNGIPADIPRCVPRANVHFGPNGLLLEGTF